VVLFGWPVTGEKVLIEVEYVGGVVGGQRAMSRPVAVLSANARVVVF